MKNRDYATIYALTALVAAFLLAATAVLADPTAPLSLAPVTSSSRNLSSIPAVAADARGGNVTEININTITITKAWQGYYGNISGIVTLQDGNNNTFYNWTLANAKAQVYATRSNSIAWANIQCANASQIVGEQVYLNQTATDSDSVTNTFSGTTHPLVAVGTKNLTANNCSTTFGYVNNNSQSANYVMMLLNSGANIVYATISNKTTVGFDGNQHDFELLVGENEKPSYVGITQYYFWTEFT